MWSGPRNISSAMMRSWGNRSDTLVCDEPLYAHYLLKTGIPHPGADEVLQSQDTNWRTVVQVLTESTVPGKAIFYQKHMSHHLLPEIERDWLDQVSNVLLIRAPREVVASFTKVAGPPTLDQTGLPQQLDLFHWLQARTGRVPPVIDARDVLEDPARMLRRLCDVLDVTFDAAMLSWPPGPRDTDGVWAKHWYGALERSTSFQPYQPKHESVPAHLAGMLGEAEAIYQQLAAHRLR